MESRIFTDESRETIGRYESRVAEGISCLKAEIGLLEEFPVVPERSRERLSADEATLGLPSLDFLVSSTSVVERQYVREIIPAGGGSYCERIPGGDGQMRSVPCGYVPASEQRIYIKGTGRELVPKEAKEEAQELKERVLALKESLGALTLGKLSSETERVLKEMKSVLGFLERYEKTLKEEEKEEEKGGDLK